MTDEFQPTEPPQRPVEDYERALMEATWYSVIDDTIGGYAVSTVDRPISGHGIRDIFVGDFMTKMISEHVAELHNHYLRQFGSDRD